MMHNLRIVIEANSKCAAKFHLKLSNVFWHCFFSYRCKFLYL